MNQSNNPDQSNIIYEPEDYHATDVFKKHLFVSNEYPDQSKVGAQIKSYIEMLEYYKQMFKGTRDSEFSEYSDIDLTEIRNARLAAIKAIRKGQVDDEINKHLEIYHIKRKRRGRNILPGQDDDVDFTDMEDLYEEVTDDEDKLIEYYQ